MLNTISEEDAARFRASVPDHPVAVTGDTRFDRVMERWQERAASTFALPAGGPTLIAGSTWPPDEERLLPALARLLREIPGLRVVVVPHEPTPAHVAPLRRWAAQTGLRTRVASDAAHDDDARVSIVDVVGVLAEAYRFADVAYVGGAFTTGVHSVIEPAIGGVPVVFGPRHDNSFEALQLVERGAARAVRTADEVYAALGTWLRDETARAAAGRAARAYVESQLGATEKCMAALLNYL